MVCGERPGRSEMEMEMEMEMVMVMGGRCVEECEGTRAGHRQRVRRAPWRALWSLPRGRAGRSGRRECAAPYSTRQGRAGSEGEVLRAPCRAVSA